MASGIATRQFELSVDSDNNANTNIQSNFSGRVPREDSDQQQEQLTIRVYFPRTDGPPQLGITVEDPNAANSKRGHNNKKERKQKPSYDHDYQNCVLPGDLEPASPSTTSIQINNGTGPSNGAKSQKNDSIQRGLKITKIQAGSVIDVNGQFRLGDIILGVNGVTFSKRNFNEAQRTLREFVIKQSSHGPLLLKVIRRSQAPTTSVPSTANSHIPTVENNTVVNSHNEPSLARITKLNQASIRSQTSSSTNTQEIRPKEVAASNNTGCTFNTRRIGTKHRIIFSKSQDGGFGIKIAARDNTFGPDRPIYITAITTTGSAFRDGRLKEGDMLLEVNRVSLVGKTQNEVTKMLKAIPVETPVEFLISRQDDQEAQHETHSKFETISNTQVETKHNEVTARQETDDPVDFNNLSLIDLDAPIKNDDPIYNSENFDRKIDNIFNQQTRIDGPGTYVYDIPLNGTKSAGLGLYLKYPALGDKDLGIWIAKVITGGAAWKDGRLQPDDQILAMNGISLINLSNAQASETLTAAVCRGIGPEATSNTIRLHIHRRDPAIVAKILHGTNNHIEHSDLATSQHIKSFSTSDTHPMKLINDTQDSYITAYDRTIHSRSQSSNETSNQASHKLSSHNSHDDSIMSPHTQANDSLKLSNDSCNGNNSVNNSSERTNDTSSAISQITDYTSVVVDNTNEKPMISIPDNHINLYEQQPTQPKTLDTSVVTKYDAHQNNDAEPGITSCDDESICNLTGEEAFQRDGFGRQSISEKRHAQLMAKNTDTFKRNQKLRDERQLQRQLDMGQEDHRSVVIDAQNLESISHRIMVPDNTDTHSLNIERHPIHDDIVIPRAGTVRVGRHRKVNDSFRAAVDKSYDHGNTYLSAPMPHVQLHNRDGSNISRPYYPAPNQGFNHYHPQQHQQQNLVLYYDDGPQFGTEQNFNRAIPAYNSHNSYGQQGGFYQSSLHHPYHSQLSYDASMSRQSSHFHESTSPSQVHNQYLANHYHHQQVPINVHHDAMHNGLKVYPTQAVPPMVLRQPPSGSHYISRVPLNTTQVMPARHQQMDQQHILNVNQRLSTGPLRNGYDKNNPSIQKQPELVDKDARFNQKSQEGLKLHRRKWPCKLLKLFKHSKNDK